MFKLSDEGALKEIKKLLKIGSYSKPRKRKEFCIIYLNSVGD